MYSSIKRKTCKNENCRKMPLLGCNGFCWEHSSPETKERLKSKQNAQRNRNNAAKSDAIKLRRLQNEINNALEGWFMLKMNTSRRRCENCGKPLDYLNAWEWRGSQHHIIEKHHCPSVETNPFNHGVLGYYCCHSQWHSSYLNARKMPFFKIAKERFQLFKNEIAQSERKNIPDCFRDE